MSFLQNDICFLTLEEVIEIHKELIDQFGGIKGIRDIGALDASLIRPQLGYYETLFEQASAIMESLANNHPFIDGNKRVSFFVTDTFLRFNGYYLDIDNLKTYDYFMRLFETQNFSYVVLLEWIQTNAKKI